MGGHIPCHSQDASDDDQKVQAWPCHANSITWHTQRCQSRQHLSNRTRNLGLLSYRKPQRMSRRHLLLLAPSRQIVGNLLSRAGPGEQVAFLSSHPVRLGYPSWSADLTSMGVASGEDGKCRWTRTAACFLMLSTSAWHTSSTGRNLMHNLHTIQPVDNASLTADAG